MTFLLSGPGLHSKYVTDYWSVAEEEAAAAGP